MARLATSIACHFRSSAVAGPGGFAPRFWQSVISFTKTADSAVFPETTSGACKISPKRAFNLVNTRGNDEFNTGHTLQPDLQTAGSP